MQPGKAGVRSRFGCRTCRHKHRKCDERRPVCRPCQSRGLECDYQVTLRWARVGNATTFRHINNNDNNSSSSSSNKGNTPNSGSGVAAASYPSPRPSASGPSCLTSPPWSAVPVAGNSRKECSPGQELRPGPDGHTAGLPTPRSQGVDSRQDVVDGGVNAPAHILPVERRGDLGGGSMALASLLELDITMLLDECDARGDAQGNQESHGSDRAYDGDDDGNQDDLPLDGLDDVEPQVSFGLPSAQRSGPDTVGYTAWVIDNTFTKLLFQIFQSPGEEIAFTYFFKRVSNCIPAYDGERNPWRKLAVVALSHPVLLHGILSVSTAHMNNYGRSCDDLLASRQSRALRTLQAAVSALEAKRDSARRDSHLSPLDGGGVFSILTATEVALGAIMMQTSSALMTGVGNVEMHMKCALHFIQDLGYLHQPADSVFSRLLVNRFAMVDVVLAHLRFRRPLAPPSFWMYQGNRDIDDVDPPFREMHGCPHRVLCFLARIAFLSADLLTPGSSHAVLQAEAYSLETEMRVWGHRYYSAMSYEASNPWSPVGTSESQSGTVSDGLASLDVVCECFYWTAHLLLMRRLLLDPTRSTRVQIIRRHIFCLMDRLTPGCGPESSLPFPFYMAAREAVTPEDRNWVRQRHAAMMEAHRDRSREYLMVSTEKIWEMADATELSIAPEGTPQWDSPLERDIRAMDNRASYFMF